MVDTSKVKPGNLITSDLIIDMAAEIETIRQKTVKINDNGNVGIGTENPVTKLHVAGGWVRVGITPEESIQLETQGTFHRVAFNELRLWDWHTGHDMVTFKDGNVGIGTTSPNEKLTIQGDASAPVALNVGGTSNAKIRVRHIDGKDYQSGNLDNLYLQYGINNHTVLNAGGSTGNVGIGVEDPSQKLDVNGNIRIRGHTYLDGTIISSTDRSHLIKFDGIEALQFSSYREGSLKGISIKISDECEFSAKIKHFLISHPLDPEHKDLVHSTLEGPEIAVFYRGEAQLSNGEETIKLPDYFEALTRKENRTVLLTPKYEGDAPVSMLATSEVEDGKFTVKMIDGKNPFQKFYWEVKAVRSDVGILNVEKPKFPRIQ